MKTVIRGERSGVEALDGALAYIREQAMAAIEDGRKIEIVLDAGSREVPHIYNPGPMEAYQRTGGYSFRIEIEPLPEGMLDAIAAEERQ